MLLKRPDMHIDNNTDENENNSFEIDFYNNTAGLTLLQKLTKKPIPYELQKDRKIFSNKLDETICNNTIQTNKYTSINFVPKNMFEQFSKKANLYFLFIGIMQMIPYVSISQNVPVIFFPLSFIIVVTALKDYFEDYKRQKSDNEENSQMIEMYDLESKAFIKKQ